MSVSLLEALDELVASCGGAITLTTRGIVDGLECVELGPRGGEWLELGVGPSSVRVRFAGWLEELALDDDPELGEDARASVLDFVAAAMFGELRVVESRLRGRVLRRSLEVRVGGVWRRQAKTGALGFAGARAWLRRDLERRVRSNEGRVGRPRPLKDAGPLGHPGAPWIGAAVRSDRRPLGSADELDIDGELDLHNFSPREVGQLVREYIEVCHARGIQDLRVVHGKGKGALRRTVHSLLERHPLVEDYRLGGHGEGSWGATIVRLRPPD